MTCSVPLATLVQRWGASASLLQIYLLLSFRIVGAGLFVAGKRFRAPLCIV